MSARPGIIEDTVAAIVVQEPIPSQEQQLQAPTASVVSTYTPRLHTLSKAVQLLESLVEVLVAVLKPTIVVLARSVLLVLLLLLFHVALLSIAIITALHGAKWLVISRSKVSDVCKEQGAARQTAGKVKRSGTATAGDGMVLTAVHS
jgi:hypothetical protein